MASDDENWTDLLGDGELLSPEWIATVFPTKAADRRQTWLDTLHNAEFDTVKELANLDEAGWTELNLPLAVRKGLQSAVVAARTTPSWVATEAALEAKRVEQIDMVVIDVSASMRSRSTLDKDKTREDVSKVLFHTLVDRMISLELPHACGLLSFGEVITPIGITRKYEQFHDELGRLDAVQGRTALYDAIFEATTHILEYEKERVTSNGGEPVPKRIFVLTDGEDNASKRAAWTVAQHLQLHGIVLDAIPVGLENGTLQSMCTASGGLCLSAVDQQQAVGLFEREAVLHLLFRESADAPPSVRDAASLAALESRSEVRCEVKSAVAKQVYAPVVKRGDSAALARMGGSSAVTKRILREFADFEREAPVGCTAFISADDAFEWKIIYEGTHGPYEGGTWLLRVRFPANYPFKPMQLRFVTPIYHCNITHDGGTCLDILKDQWSPALTISKVMLSIDSLLGDPNCEDPLDSFKGQLCRDDHKEYNKQVAAHTRRFASVGRQALIEQYNCE